MSQYFVNINNRLLKSLIMANFYLMDKWNLSSIRICNKFDDTIYENLMAKQ